MKFVCLLLTFSKFSCETLEDVFISLRESEYMIVGRCWKKNRYIFSFYRIEFCSFFSEEISNVPAVTYQGQINFCNPNFIP